MAVDGDPRRTARRENVLCVDSEWASLDEYRRAADAEAKTLDLVKSAAIDEGLALFCVTKNEADLLPRFLAHYRALGIKRFFFIDNASDDTTCSLLSNQADVTLYFTQQPYGRHYLQWLDGLIERHCAGQWIVRVDTDELLVYDQCETVSLQELIVLLETDGLRRLLAPLVDVYGSFDDLYFDAAPLSFQWIAGLGPLFFGGPRARMNARYDAQGPCLTKYPLALYDRQTCFAHPHFASSPKHNHTKVLGALVHTKIIRERFNRKIIEALESGQHWKSSIEYQVYALWVDEDMQCELSHRYLGPSDLIAAGVMLPIDWSPSARTRRQATAPVRRLATRLRSLSMR